MKYLLPLLPLLLLVACNRPPSQEEIDTAASRQLSMKLACALIASELGSKGEIHRLDDGRPRALCDIFIKGKSPGFFGFDEDEVRAIDRYILIKREYTK